MPSPSAFLIVGLPRSRTAWLAAFLNNGPVVCYHELMRSCGGARNYLMAFRSAPVFGDSSSMVPSYYSQILHMMPPHRLAFIIRDPYEARLAAERMMREEAGIEPTPERWEGIEGRFNTMLEQNPTARRFAFEDLDDRDTVCELSEYLTGQPFDDRRYEIMKDLRVTVIPQKAYAKVWAQYAEAT